MNWRKYLAAVLLAGALTMNGATKITEAEFGKLPDGAAIRIYTLTNKNGLSARIMNYGAVLVSLNTPDRKGEMGDIVLGFDSLSDYLATPRFFGAIVGRYGNRIGGAQFKLDGKEYQLEKNNGPNSLHGGTRGFDKQVWTAAPLPDGGLKLTYLSKDGEGGYPGNLTATVTYHLTDKNELRIDYAATTDKPTVVNLTNHSFWNLAGAGSGDTLKHQLMLNADRFTPVDAGLIPTGELKAVDGTPFDFRKPTAIGARIDQQDDAQLKITRGYDHNFVLNRKGKGLSLAARVEDPASGRVLEVLTAEPGIQFFSGNSLRNISGKGGKVYGPRSGFCLETQHFPDSPNKPDFPSTVLKPGQQYRTTTVYRLLTSRPAAAPAAPRGPEGE